MRHTLSALMVACLFGCAHQSVEVNITATSQVGLNKVSPANPRVGFVGRGSTEPGIIVLQLTRDAFQGSVTVNTIVIARSRTLEPTAVLKILEIRGMAARATLVRGQPESDDEVVLPSPKLREAADRLPLFKTDT